MKVRGGFVSNSSSSSFLIKTDMSKKEIKELLQNVLDIHNKYIRENKTKLAYEDVYSELYDIPGGRTVIETNGDNSIPYWISEFLEMKFNVLSIHGYIGYKADNDID